MSHRKKILYMSPLKALSAERFDDWVKRFPGKKVLMLTGDTLWSEKERAKQMEEAITADIIIATSELVDSITRRMKQEKYFWLNSIGLVIVDESHMLTTERGHPIECGLMRFAKINPDARIVFLSATMPNVGELGEWLTVLNHKQTEVVYCTWRPVPLQMHYVEYVPVISTRGYQNYQATQSLKRQIAIDIIESKPDEKFLVFVHDKGTGRQIIRDLANKDIESQFHNADLDKEDRTEIEKSFRQKEGGLRILISTSTTAYGLNLPARNVIIVGVHRGINEVDSLDIIQEAGRSGRYGIDTEGFVYLIIPSGSKSSWEEVFKNPRPVMSVLKDHATIAFHVLAEMLSREIRTERDIEVWFRRSLANKQGLLFEAEDIKGLIKDLLEMEMIVRNNDGLTFSITPLGKVGAYLYISPYDVYAWYKNFGRLLSNASEDVPAMSDLELAWAVADIPDHDWGYLPKELKQECEEIQWKLRNRGINLGCTAHFVWAAYQMLQGADINGPVAPLARAIRYDIRRINQALIMIDSMYAKWGTDLWKILPDRIIYGIPAEMAELVKLPGIGGKRARSMWDIGIRSIADVANKDNKKKIYTILGAKISKTAIEAAIEKVA